MKSEITESIFNIFTFIWCIIVIPIFIIFPVKKEDNFQQWPMQTVCYYSTSHQHFLQHSVWNYFFHFGNFYFILKFRWNVVRRYGPLKHLALQHFDPQLANFKLWQYYNQTLSNAFSKGCFQYLMNILYQKHLTSRYMFLKIRELRNLKVHARIVKFWLWDKVDDEANWWRWS